MAECVVWDGALSLEKKIDQLLGYACWRDTKTAILVFNRRRGFTQVVEQIPDVVRGHPKYVRDMEYKHESGFRFVMKHRDDPERELLLTVLAFDVPSGE